MPDAGWRWMLDVGCWMLDAASCTLDAECQTLEGAGCWMAQVLDAGVMELYII